MSRKHAKWLPLLVVLVLVGCGGGGGSPAPKATNFGPKALPSSVIPAVPNKHLNHKPQSPPKARPPGDLVPVKP